MGKWINVILSLVLVGFDKNTAKNLYTKCQNMQINICCLNPLSAYWWLSLNIRLRIEHFFQFYQIGRRSHHYQRIAHSNFCIGTRVKAHIAFRFPDRNDNDI